MLASWRDSQSMWQCATSVCMASGEDGKQTRPARAVGVGVASRSGGVGTVKARIRTVW
jgi:hypothetical protein